MAAKNKNRFSAGLRMLAKAGIAVIAIILIYRNKGSILLDGLGSFDLWSILPAAVISVLTLFISAARWRALAGLINIRISRFEAFSLTMQGNFFSLIIPGGAVGGDVVKMAALSGHLPNGCRTEGIFSILMDRIVGMVVLFGIGLLLLFVDRQLFASLAIPGLDRYHNTGIMCWWLFTAICLAGLAAAAILSMYGKIKNLPFAGILTDFADRKTSGKVSRIINACDLYSDKKSALCFWMLITALIHLAPAFSMMFLLNGCGASGIILLAAIPAVVIGNIAGIIPLFPGGIGARDAITIALLTAAGCSLENAIAAQLLATGMLIIFNLTGALFFIFDRKRPEAIQ